MNVLYCVNEFDERAVFVDDEQRKYNNRGRDDRECFSVHHTVECDVCASCEHQSYCEIDPSIAGGW